MTGLELAEAYYRAVGQPMVAAELGAAARRVAVGLAGPGSECFGFDDLLSRDHDWGPGFCLWLDDDDYARYGEPLQQAYRQLPTTFGGFGPRIVSDGEEGRVGVARIKTFYHTYTGLAHPPQSLHDWLQLSEQALGLATNGRVFSDSHGLFSHWRKVLLEQCPDDVRLHKIASRCMTVAQSGQYNYQRCLQRGEVFAAQAAENQFCRDAMELLFLLNRRYPPFYKWLHHACRQLPLGGDALYGLVAGLLKAVTVDGKQQISEQICRLLVAELQRQQLTDSHSDFLAEHAASVHGRISDGRLRSRFVLAR
ncbi:MAG: DUF4037 domain-containing protein [Desulfuromonas sp.]|nr:DUF4037 domain-containing protein [Desulfuromonas sp.]